MSDSWGLKSEEEGDEGGMKDGMDGTPGTVYWNWERLWKHGKHEKVPGPGFTSVALVVGRTRAGDERFSSDLPGVPFWKAGGDTMRRYPFIALAAFLRDTLGETRAYRPFGISGCFFPTVAHFCWLAGLQLLQVAKQWAWIWACLCSCHFAATFLTPGSTHWKGASTWGDNLNVDSLARTCGTFGCPSRFLAMGRRWSPRTGVLHRTITERSKIAAKKIMRSTWNFAWSSQDSQRFGRSFG